MVDNEICPICHDDFTEKSRISAICGHHYHNVCLANWEESRKKAGIHFTCPLCRTVLQHDLMSAIELNDIESVELLLRNGANIEARKWGETPLTYAIHHGHFKIVELLLENRADIESRNLLGHTALIEASIEGFLDIVKLLLEKGANINACCKNGHTALIEAIKYRRIEIIELLIKESA